MTCEGISHGNGGASGACKEACRNDRRSEHPLTVAKRGVNMDRKLAKAERQRTHREAGRATPINISASATTWKHCGFGVECARIAAGKNRPVRMLWSIRARILASIQRMLWSIHASQ